MRMLNSYGTCKPPSDTLTPWLLSAVHPCPFPPFVSPSTTQRVLQLLRSSSQLDLRCRSHHQPLYFCLLFWFFSYPPPRSNRCPDVCRSIQVPKDGQPTILLPIPYLQFSHERLLEPVAIIRHRELIRNAPHSDFVSSKAILSPYILPYCLHEEHHITLTLSLACLRHMRNDNLLLALVFHTGAGPRPLSLTPSPKVHVCIMRGREESSRDPSPPFLFSRPCPASLRVGPKISFLARPQPTFPQ